MLVHRLEGQHSERGAEHGTLVDAHHVGRHVGQYNDLARAGGNENAVARGGQDGLELLAHTLLLAERRVTGSTHSTGADERPEHPCEGQEDEHGHTSSHIGLLE